MITHENLQVEGLPFGNIFSMEISQRVNEHGYATIVGEMSSDNAQKCVERADETTKIIIKSKEKPSITLFVGGVIHISEKRQHEYSLVTVMAVSSSYLQDIKKESRSFQNIKQKYAAILQAAFQGNGSVTFKATDKECGTIVIQLEETNWEFAKRIASQFNVPLFASISSDKPSVCVGLPSSNKKTVLETDTYSYLVDNEAYQRKIKNQLPDEKEPIQQDFAVACVETDEYLCLGDIVNFNKKDYYIKSVNAQLANGVMLMSYELAGKTGFVIAKSSIENLAGRIMTGQVKEVKEDKVKVHLVDIDEKYDTASEWWFTYSTPYSSKDGSGWYVMPEKDDIVRIIFPSANPEEGFAASAVNTAPGKKPEDKRFKAPAGKELLFTKEGLYIICKHQKIFINLTDADGIQIVSAGEINIVSSSNISIQADKDVQVMAKKQVLLGTPGSAINITPSKIVMAAKSIVLT